jgi:hypothetical protein
MTRIAMSGATISAVSRDNSELSTDLWLWYAYLRTGRADVFRMAEAMTRHTGEVDVYHLGRFKGSARVTGCSIGATVRNSRASPTPPIAASIYYLTADERCGDLMHALIDSDQTLRQRRDRAQGRRPRARRSDGGNGAVVAEGTLPPAGLRPVRHVWGPLVAAWMTEWERTRSTLARPDRRGHAHAAALPRNGSCRRCAVRSRHGTLCRGGDTSMSHLNGVFGVFETMAELLELVDVPAYRAAWIDYCAYYNAPPLFRAKPAILARGAHWRRRIRALTAYAWRPRTLRLPGARAEFTGAGDRAGSRSDEGHAAHPAACGAEAGRRTRRRLDQRRRAMGLAATANLRADRAGGSAAGLRTVRDVACSPRWCRVRISTIFAATCRAGPSRPSRGQVDARDGVLDIDAADGVTIWYRQRLKGPVAIDYDVMAVAEGGAHDAVSDVNAFWMARDPRVKRGSVLARRRDGAFASYDDLETYYVGIGGNRNSTTRMRRYVGRKGIGRSCPSMTAAIPPRCWSRTDGPISA